MKIIVFRFHLIILIVLVLVQCLHNIHANAQSIEITNESKESESAETLSTVSNEKDLTNSPADAGNVNEIANTSHDTDESVEQGISNNVSSNSQEEIGDVTLSVNNQSITAKNDSEAKIRCILKELSERETPTVHLVNSSALVKALSPVPNVTVGECAVVMFYSPYCVFSAKAAPHFNAIPRVFPDVSFYAIDAITYTSLNMRYGLVAVPTVLLFHNGKASAKYNDSEPTLEKMVSFLTKYTGISPEGNVTLLPEDSDGPISSIPLERRDYVLILSWIFTIVFCCVQFAKSAMCRKIVECVLNTWQEAEAQHEHEE